MDKIKKLKLIKIGSLVSLILVSLIPFTDKTSPSYRSVFGAYLILLDGISVMFFVGILFLLSYLGTIALSVLSFLGKYENNKLNRISLISFIPFIYLVVRNMVYSSNGYVILLIIVLLSYIACLVFNYKVNEYIKNGHLE